MICRRRGGIARRHYLAEVLRAFDYSDKELFAVYLALEEALVNAIKHGNGEDPLKSVQMRYQATPERVLIEILDEGASFDPKRVADPMELQNLDHPGGRGVYLSQHYMTWGKYDEAGNGVTLCKVQAASERSPVDQPSYEGAAHQ